MGDSLFRDAVRLSGVAPFRLNSQMTLIDLAEIRPDSHVTLHYRLALEDGNDVVNTFNDRPATLLLGSGQLAAPLEQVLLGLRSGQRSTFRLPPAQAFGERNPELVQKVATTLLREQGMADDDLIAGDLIEFNAPGGGRYAGVLKELHETYALFDFNHPLAGRTLTFEVQIIGIL